MKVKILSGFGTIFLFISVLHGQPIKARILDSYFNLLVQQRETDATINSRLQELSPELLLQYQELTALRPQEDDALLAWTYFYEKLKRMKNGAAPAELCREGQRINWLLKRFNSSRIVDPLAQAVIDTSQSFQRLAFFDIENGDRVAEIGIGAGFNIRLLGLVYDNVELYANEINNYYLKKLEDDLVSNLPADRRHKFHFVPGAERSTNLEGQELDLIILENVLHHIEDQVAFVDSMAKSLNENGDILVIEEFKGSRPNDHKCPDLMWRPDLDQLFKAAGFKQVAFGELTAQYKTVLRFARNGHPE